MNQPQTVKLRAINQAGEIEQLYLHLDQVATIQGERVYHPLVLGTGRNAVVLLATTSPHQDSPATDFRAIKLLRDNIDHQFARNSAGRFMLEVTHAKRFDRTQGAFVTYYGLGALGRPGDLVSGISGQARDFWWDNSFSLKEALMLITGQIDIPPDLLSLEEPYQWDSILQHPMVARYIDEDAPNTAVLQQVRDHYDLQGVFYVQHLCQGTLHDLLDRNTPWHYLPVYHQPRFHSSIKQQAQHVCKDVQHVVERYMTSFPAPGSGYDILNHFRIDDIDANRVRNFAVLELFSQVAYTVSQLHQKQERFPDQEPLAHRDLKPGNLFIRHDVNFDGWGNADLLLSDLGYVTTPQQIIRGDYSLISGQKGDQALGSQFYRAPEQATFPVEVEVDIDLEDPENRPDIHHVQIRSNKLNHVDIHDWLSISDLVNDGRYRGSEDTRLFRILAIERRGGSFRARLDTHRYPISASITRNLQGHVIKATGFQTDGFSLGAILYDLISGGRDPQDFYTYCIQGLIGYIRADYTIDTLVDHLLPREPSPQMFNPHDKLNLAERRRMLQAIVREPTVGELFARMQSIIEHHMPFSRRQPLSLLNRFALIRSVFPMNNIDSWVYHLITSDSFEESPPQTLQPEYIREPAAQDLLKDKRGVLIPREILKIIVACMVRDREGSYYVRDPHEGYTSSAGYNASQNIYHDVQSLLSTWRYMLPNTGFPRSLQRNLLFKMRSVDWATYQPESTGSV